MVPFGCAVLKGIRKIAVQASHGRANGAISLPTAALRAEHLARVDVLFDLLVDMGGPFARICNCKGREEFEGPAWELFSPGDPQRIFPALFPA
jgi:hypothetical protein